MLRPIINTVSSVLRQAIGKVTQVVSEGGRLLSSLLRSSSRPAHTPKGTIQPTQSSKAAEMEVQKIRKEFVEEFFPDIKNLNDEQIFYFIQHILDPTKVNISSLISIDIPETADSSITKIIENMIGIELPQVYKRELNEFLTKPERVQSLLNFLTISSKIGKMQNPPPDLQGEYGNIFSKMKESSYFLPKLDDLIGSIYLVSLPLSNQQLITESFQNMKGEWISRDAIHLNSRGGKLSLMNEFKIPIVLPGDDSTMVNLKGKMVEICITHPKTLETNTILVPLPDELFGEQLTVEQAKERLLFLKELFEAKDDKEKDNKFSGLLAYKNKILDDFYRAYRDFSTTREHPESRKLYLKEGLSREEQMAQGNLYLYEGKLSLSPNELIDVLLSDTALETLSVGGKITFTDPDLEGDIELSVTSEEKEDKDHLLAEQLVITITHGEHKRTAYIRIKNREDFETLLQTSKENGMIHRELLLAKSQFLREKNAS